MLAEFVDLGMAIVAAGDAVISSRRFDLLVFEQPVLEALILEPGLEESAAAATAKIIGAIGLHIDEVLFTNNGLYHKTQVFGNRVAVAFANDLAGVLDGEFDFQVPVPVGADLQFAVTNPLGVVFIDVLDFESVLDVEFFPSCQD